MHTDHSYDCATPVEVLLAEARGPWPGRDRGHRPQRDLGRARGAREGRRGQGDRRRGGQDRRAGRGDRPVHRGEDPARDDARRRRSPRSSARAASSTCPHPFDRHALGARLRAPAGGARRGRRDRGLQPARRDRRVQRGGGPLRGQVPDPGRRRAPTPTCRRGSARCGSGCATSTARRSSCESLRDADIVRNPASLLYVQALKFLQTKAMPGRGPPGLARAPRAPRDRTRRASPDALARTSSPSRPIRGAMPATDDEIREKYLERAIRELNAFARRAAGLPALPARPADAGARLRPPAGRHLPGQVLGPARRRSRRASPSTAAPATR